MVLESRLKTWHRRLSVQTTAATTRRGSSPCGQLMTFEAGGAVKGQTVITIDLDRRLFDANKVISKVNQKMLGQLSHAYDAYYIDDPADDSLSLLDFSICACGKGLLEVERTLHKWMIMPLKDNPVPEYMAFGSGTSFYQSKQDDTTPGGPPPVITSIPGDPGPSFYAAIEKNNLAVPYISDCYDQFENKNEYLHAWMLLAQTAALVLEDNVVIILAICCRDFAQYATISFNNEPPRGNNTIINTNAKRATVLPLSARLWWSNAEDRVALHDLSHGIAAWIRMTYDPDQNMVNNN